MTGPPTIDRALMARDLERLSELIGTAMESRLESIREDLVVTVPLPFGRSMAMPIGRILPALPPAYPQRLISASMARLLTLDDAALGAILDLVGQELGAWRGALPPVDGRQLEAAAPALEQLVDVTG